jgi:hypothetical protein
MKFPPRPDDLFPTPRLLQILTHIYVPPSNFQEIEIVHTCLAAYQKTSCSKWQEVQWAAAS